ncbi:MAG: hypothetical protein LBS66_01570 [Rhodospirillaceae bacterium]|nr:hypothetical protein [Rhodospirillaceae bacterium]
MIAVDANITLEKLIEIINKNRHSRYPVFRCTLGNAIVLVDIKNVLLAYSNLFKLQRIIHKVLFVSSSIRLLDLLQKMHLKRTHMALIVDEYGGCY